MNNKNPIKLLLKNIKSDDNILKELAGNSCRNCETLECEARRTCEDNVRRKKQWKIITSIGKI